MDRTKNGLDYKVTRYRPKIVGGFARIEKWANKSGGDTYSRSVSQDNATSIYGINFKNKVSNPQDTTKIFGG